MKYKFYLDSKYCYFHKGESQFGFICKEGCDYFLCYNCSYEVYLNSKCECNKSFKWFYCSKNPLQTNYKYCNQDKCGFIVCYHGIDSQYECGCDKYEKCNNSVKHCLYDNSEFGRISLKICFTHKNYVANICCIACKRNFCFNCLFPSFYKTCPNNHKTF